jgi:polysaccharide export outer membrane protein
VLNYYKALGRTLIVGMMVSVVLVALNAALGPAAWAQGADTPDQEQATALGAGDWVRIRVSGQPDATSYVGGDGTIAVPLVGNIPVAGISPVQAAARIAKALKDGGYFVDPQVTIAVTAPTSQFASVVGEVRTQGRFPITGRTTIVDLLAQAGGVNDTAADVGYVLRSDESGHVERYPVNLSMVRNGEGALPNWTFVGGDRLIVPPADLFFIEGEVSNPGKYRIEPGMTVLDALTRAGGVTEKGSERRIQLKRRSDKPGQYKTLHVKSGDLVKAGDIIRVKESLF